MADNSVSIEILAEIDKSVKSLSQFQKEASANFDKIAKDNQIAFNKISENSTSSLQKISSGFKVLGAAAGAAVAFIAGREVIGAFNDAVKAASEEQDAINQLNTALQLTGVYSKDTSEKVTNFADSLEKTTKFSGEAVLGAQALIQNLGRLSADGLNKATQASADLSAALGIDLQTAAQLVGKAAQGNVSAFKRYGLEITESTNKTKTFEKTLAEIEKRFGGAAAAQVNTFSGATTQLNNSIDEASKSFGRLIVDNPVVIASIKLISDGFRSFAELISDNGPIITNFTNSLIDLAIKGIGPVITIAEILTKTFLFFREIALKIFLAVTSVVSAFLDFKPVATLITNQITILKNSFALLLAPVSGLVQAFSVLTGTEKFLQPLVDKLDNLGGSLLSLDSTKAFDSLKSGINSLGDGAASALENSDKLFQSTEQGFNKARDFSSGLKGNLDELVSKIKNTERSVKAVGGAFGENEDAAEKSLNLFKEYFGKLEESSKGLARELSKQSQSKLEQISTEYKLSQDLIKSTQAQLDANTELSTKDREAAQEKINDFKELILLKKNLSEGDVSFGDLNINEFIAATKSLFSSVKKTLTEGLDLKTISTSFLSSLSSGLKTVKDNLGKLTLGDIGAGLSAAFSAGADVLKGVVSGDYLEKISKFLAEFTGNLPEVFTKSGAKLTKAFESAITNLPGLADAIVPIIQNIATIIASKAPEFASAILGAITKLIQAAPKIIDIFIRGLPALLNAILKRVPDLITAIANGIPQVVRSIAAVLPELVTVLANNIGPIVLALTEGIISAVPEIIIALVDELVVKGGIFRIVGALIAAMPQIALALVQGIFRGLSNVADSLSKVLGAALGKAFSGSIKLPKFEIPDSVKDLLSGKKFVDKIKEGFEEIFKKLRDALTLNIGGGGKGGIGGFVGKVGGALSGKGFAEGGQGFLKVPGGFPNDTFPARLTSGELVVDRSTAEMLRSYLDEKTSGSADGGVDIVQTLGVFTDKIAGLLESRPVMVSLSIGDQQIAQAVYNAKRRGYRV